MSIRTAKELVCDRCHWSERLDGPTITAEWPSLANAGWTRKAGKHLCPKCSPTKRARHSVVEFENAELGEQG